MKLQRIGNDEVFNIKDKGSLNKSSYPESKPKYGIWFSQTDDWFLYCSSQYQKMIVDKKKQYFEFSGNLLNQNDLKDSHFRRINNLKVLDFDAIRNDGYSGFVCTNPDVTYCFGWDVESVVIWDQFDKLNLLSEDVIILPEKIVQDFIEYYLRQIHEDFQDSYKNFNSDIIPDIGNILFLNRVPINYAGLSETMNVYEKFKKDFDSLNDFLLDNRAFIQITYLNQNNIFSYEISFYIVIDDQRNMLDSLKRELDLSSLSKKEMEILIKQEINKFLLN